MAGLGPGPGTTSLGLRRGPPRGGGSRACITSLARIRAVINTSMGIVTARSGGPMWGQSELQTHTGSLYRGRGDFLES